MHEKEFKNETVKQDRVKITKNNNLYVDGKPFFPVGLWKIPGQKEQYLSELRKNGFNVLMTVYENNFDIALLNMAQKYDFKVIIDVHGIWYRLKYMSHDFPLWFEKEKTKIKKEIEKYKKHPALLGYFIIDEPVWTKVPLEPLLAVYNFFKENDPFHPVFLNHAPRNTIEELAEYNNACDITGVDIYPVPSEIGHSDLMDKTISCVGKYVDKMQASVNNQKPVWMTLQGFSWKHYFDFEDNGDYPTWEQMRFMSYDSIVHGAKGLLFWGTQYIKNPDFWQILFGIASELNKISDILSGETISQPSLKVNNDGIVFIEKRYDGKHYIIAVNEKNISLNAEFNTILHDKQLNVLFENRSIFLENGSFVDRFLPYDVHIYTNEKNLSTSLSNFRKDFYIDKKGIIKKTIFLNQFPVYHGEANWICYPQSNVSDSDVFFRKTFNLEQEICSSNLLIAAYGNYSLYINGKKIPHKNIEWNIMCKYDITSYMKKGKNIIAIHLMKKNILPQALIVEIELITSRKKKIKFISDDSFLVDNKETPQWYREDFDDSIWKKAEISKKKRFVQRIIPYEEILLSDFF